MTCPKCKHENIRAFITIHMYIDADDNYKLTKGTIRKKSTEIWSQDHNKDTYVCQNPECCYCWGFGYNEKE